MGNIAIKFADVSKQYRLGLIGSGTISHDINRWWSVMRGKGDPCQRVGEATDYTSKKENEYIWALRNINLEVKRGEVLGIIGKNGAGKSTLLKILSRITNPTKGCVMAKGRIASLLEVGTGFHPEMTGRENIFMNGSIMGMNKSEIRKKFDEIVDFSGVERYIETPVKRYSSGMIVRLGFAVAAHLEPEILVVDEVLAVGDAEFQKKALRKMQDVSGQDGRTVLFVSHNMAGIQALCTEAIILKDGTIDAAGDVEDLIKRYLSSTVAKTTANYRGDKLPKGRMAWIEEASVTSKGEPAASVLCGQELVISVGYRAVQSNLRASLYLGIYNDWGEKILHLGTPYGELGNFNTSQEGLVNCVIPKLALLPGRYSLNLSLHINGEPHHRVTDALCFTVETGDYYGTGKMPGAKEGKVLAEHTWEHK